MAQSNGKRPRLVVIGNRTATEIVEVAKLAHGDEFDRIDSVFLDEETFAGGVVPEWEEDGHRVYFHIGIADLAWKMKAIERCRAVGWSPFTVIHPSAVVSCSAAIGAGVFVGPLAVISANASIGDFALVHIHASIGHDAGVHELTSVLPGARLSGNTVVGARSMVGSNAFIAAGVTVGDDCQVDALTYVARDLPDAHLLSMRHSRPVRRPGFPGR